MKHDSVKEEILTKKLMQLIREKDPKDIEQLIDFMVKETSIPKEAIIEQVLSLVSQGKIKLTETLQKPPPKFSNYLKTEDANWYWITLFIATVTTITVFAIPEDAYPLVYMRYVLGTIFVLWLPGYSFVRALFPAVTSTTKKGLDSVERLALSIGMSLALVPIVGLLLNYTPWGIRQTPIVTSLLLLTAAFATVAVIREHHEKLTMYQKTT